MSRRWYGCARTPPRSSAPTADTPGNLSSILSESNPLELCPTCAPPLTALPPATVFRAAVPAATVHRRFVYTVQAGNDQQSRTPNDSLPYLPKSMNLLARGLVLRRDIMPRAPRICKNGIRRPIWGPDTLFVHRFGRDHGREPAAHLSERTAAEPDQAREASGETPPEPRARQDSLK